MKPPLERLDSYILGLGGLGAVGLFFGVGAVIFASTQFEPYGWLVFGSVLTGGSAMAIFVGMIGHAIHLAAQSIIESSARTSAAVPPAQSTDAATSS